ncbi:MAG: flippase-like domain-containing protein, partial [Anaerolineales bacterium]|nr:flippase-like domain-containing protein [Anaerolineales bacterium]
MSARIWNRSLLLTALAVAIVSAISVWVAWRASAEFTARLAGLILAPIFGAALISYALRVLRFHYFLSRSGVAMSLPNTLVAQMIGFALAVTPGRVGEVFKLHLIRERTGTPIAQTAPLLLLERLTEGGGFLLLALASAPLLPALRSRLPMPALTIVGLAAIVAFALTRDFWSRRVYRADARLTTSRVWQFCAPHLKNLWAGLQTSFTPTQILGGLLLSTIARFADGVGVLFAAQMFGVELELPEAIFILAVSGLAGGISFLPAGLGAVETTMIGLLVLVGAPWSNALAIALVMRLFTLWL